MTYKLGPKKKTLANIDGALEISVHQEGSRCSHNRRRQEPQKCLFEVQCEIEESSNGGPQYTILAGSRHFEIQHSFQIQNLAANYDSEGRKASELERKLKLVL